MRNSILFFLVFIFICSGSFLQSQDCGCTIKEVQDNSVEPCTMVVGEVVNVSTAAELRTAIIQANNSGGNMTILLADGTYPIASSSWYPYITASNLVFRSASGNRDAVIWTGTGMHDVSPGVEIGIFAVGDNITIADLTIRDVGNHGIAATGENLFVHNVRIQNTFEQMLKGTSGSNGADDALVQCSLFEYPAGVGPQFYIGGLDIHDGDNWIVRDNIFRNIASPSGSLAEHAIHFWNSSSNNLIERNMIYNCDRGIGFGLGSSPNDGGIIRNNMIYNDGTGLFDDVGIGLETSPNTKVYNNTVYVSYPNAIEYRFDATQNVDIRNNLCNKIIRSRNGGQATLGSNYTNAQASWFEDMSNGDLRLNADIPELANQGEVLSDVTDDIDQNPRPAFGGIDIGACEIESTTTVKEELPNSSDFVIYPNPAIETCFVRSESVSNFSIDIFDLEGRRVEGVFFFSSKGVHNIDVRKWENGIYLCRISYNSKSEILPLVVQH